MTEENPVLIDSAHGVTTITLNRPQRLNALNVPLLEKLHEGLEWVEGAGQSHVVVLTGAGKAFSAGVDLQALAEQGIDLAAGDVGGALNDAARKVIAKLGSMRQATIAKVNGFCFTGALELMLGCDFAIAAAEAKLGDTHAMLGIRPTWGMTQRLPRAVGMARAKEMSFSARHVTGSEAAEYGLVLEAVPAAELDARVDAITRGIAANSAGAIAAYKDLYGKAANAGLDEGLAYEFGTAYEIADTRARYEAFMAKLKKA
ncbi:enoyl-CoA hydratase/isomerase family protein [Marinibaculum pumilum]|uniref:Enoyl-CoA hydratase/isomerase family protein n=1 Tax=Marinibaculum pumilum TaxID=1766165 RepID=A0ABV7L2A5_9PROT